MSEKKRKKEAAEGSKEHKKRSDEGRLHRENWKEYTATVEDIQNFLMDRILLRHNVITRRVEYRLPSSYESEGTEWQPISDRVVNSLWSELSAEKVVRAQDIYRVLESDFVPEFNPFTFYLEHLPPWNGEDYIFAMSVSVSVKAPIKREKSDACIGSIPDPWSPTRSLSEREEAQSEIKGEVEEQMLFAQYLKKWLVGMVAGWIDPHVVNNVILVLIGEQGSYKTTWFNYILPPELRAYFYTKTNASRMGRDDLLILAQYGLVCCEELDTMRPSELNQLKAAVTMPSIDERAAYAHFHEHRKHIASFCGTGNNMQFLSDPTGNRRWLPFEVESIESPREELFEYEGIYAQAYALYQQGFQFWFSREEILKLAEHNRQFETPRLESELVQLYFRKPVGVEGGIFMSVARAMQIVSANISQKISAVYLGRAFMEQGFRRVKSCGQRGYIVEQRTGEEIQRLQRQMADDVDVDSGQ